MDQAEHYCEKFGKRPVHIADASTYVGSFSEDNYNTIKTGAKIAQAGGIATTVFGGKKERNAGAAFGLGGATVDGVMDPGYEYAMKFKCVP